MKCLTFYLCLVGLLQSVLAQSACASITNAVVGSICGTLAFVALVALVFHLILRKVKKKEHERSLTGYDNPLTIDEKGKDKGNGFTPKREVISYENIDIEQPSDNEVFSNENTTDDLGSSDAHTCLLDNKTHPTNGFSVIPQDGDIVIADVNKIGPAYGKLHEGDSIVSVTVFFDDISYENALTLLSTAAPYKVAVSVTKKIPRQTLQVQVEQEVPSTYYQEVDTEPRVHEETTVQTVTEQPLESAPPTAIDNPVYAVPHARRDNTLKRKSSPEIPPPYVPSSSSSCSEDDVTVITTLPPVDKSSEEPLHGKHYSSASSSDKEEEKQDTSDKEDSPPTSSDDREVVVEPQEAQRSRSNSTTSNSSSSSKSSSNKSKNFDETSSDQDSSKKEEFYVAEEQPEPPVYETPSKKREEIVFTSGWRKLVKLLDLHKAGLVNEATMKKLEFGHLKEADVAKDLKPFLCGEEPIAGLLISETGERMSFFDASKQGIIRRGTGVSLLEAQAATGSIINPTNGDKMTVDEAKEIGLLDKQIAAVLIRAERAVNGYETRLSDEPLSLFQAMKRKLIVENHGIRLLEAQIATGGIIDPKANHRLPLEVAYERGLFNDKLRQILDDPSDDTKGFFDPNTGENLTYMELLERCVIDQETALKLLPFSNTPRRGKTL